MCEASYIGVDSLKFDRTNWNTKVPANDKHYWLTSFSKYRRFLGLCGLPYVAVVWQVTARHHLLYDPLPHALPLLSFPVLSAFTLIPSTVSHLWNQPYCARWCWLQYVDAVLTLLCSFIRKCAHTHTYIHTNASSESNCPRLVA